MPDEVSVLSPVGSGRRQASVARIDYVRVNNAIFGTRSGAVSRAVQPLVARVAADGSGRTRLTQRILGRTVSIMHLPARKLIVYSVRAD